MVTVDAPDNKKTNGSRFTMQKILSATKSYDKISLSELENSNANLLSRKESKYLMTFEQFLELASVLSGHYRVLDVKDCRVTSYETLYYDNDSFLTYQQHHNGKKNRYKLRVRHYSSSGERYVEIKKKKNNGVTVKKRMKAPDSTEIEKEYDQFLRSEFPYDYHDFHPVLMIEYRRITFVSRDMNERITFDFDLSYRNDDKEISVPKVVIGEVKRDKSVHDSRAISEIRNLGIRERSFSKYCIGTSLVYEHLKHNRFKANLLYLSRVSGVEATC